MNQYNQYHRPNQPQVRYRNCYPNFRPRIGGGVPNNFPNPQAGTFFNHNYHQQRHNAPYLQLPRYGPPPPMIPAPGSCWRFNPGPINTPPPVLHSPAKRISSPPNNAIPRPRGPRTPPDPPPDSPETVATDFARVLSPSLSPKRKSHKQKKKARQKLRKQQEMHYGDTTNEKIQRRRNSCPIQMRRSSLSLYNNCSPASSHKSTEEPSPLNTAVQAYLLQVLTSQPPPGSVQLAQPTIMFDQTGGTSSKPPSYHPPLPPTLPPETQTPPPLPPSPMQSKNPPPQDHEVQIGVNSDATIKEGLNLEKWTSELTIAIPNDSEHMGNQEMENNKVVSPLIKIKSKRKKISARNGSLKDWTVEEALMALKVEQDLSKEVNKDTILFLRFPDPPLTREIVKTYSPDSIESVHFQQNSAPRFCFAHLRAGVDVDKIIETISKIPFGAGYVKAEIRQLPPLKTNATTKAENIDPFTLYVGNLSTTVPCKVLKEHFPRAARIDIGFAQRMKYTRYAFIRYHKVEESIAAYRRMFNKEIDGRSLILRFRRFGATSREGDLDNSGISIDDEEQTDAYSMISSTPTIPTEIAESSNMPLKEGVVIEGEKLRLAIQDIDLNQSLELLTEPQIEDNVVKSVGEMETDLQTEKNQDHAIDDAVECVTVEVQKSVEIPLVEGEAEEATVAKTIPKTVDTHEVEPHAKNKEQELECNVNDTTNHQLDAAKENNTSDAEIEHVSIENIEKTNSMAAPSISTISIQENSVDVDVPSVKSEPNQSIDDDDIVSNHTIPRRNCDLNVKEESTLDDELEFFSGGISSQNKETEEEFFASQTKETALDSSDSSCSLSNFLRFCESSRDENSDGVDNSTAPPPAKKPKSTKSQLIVATQARKISSIGTEVKLEDNGKDSIQNEDDLMVLRQSLKDKENAAPSPIKEEFHRDSIDDDILIIDSDDYLLRTINGDMVEEFISQPSVSNNADTGHRHRNRKRLINENNDDDDVVPPNAFIFKGHKTTTKNLPIRPLLLKEERIEWEPKSSCSPVDKRTAVKEHQITAPTKADSLKSTQATCSPSNANTVKRKSLILPPNDDDDVVPENNALGSRQSSIAFFDLTLEDEPVVSIKSEIETEDLFLLPKNTDRSKNSRQSTEKRISELKQEITKRNLQRKLVRSSKNKQTNDERCKATDEEDDDDIVIITDDITPVTRGNQSEELKRETPSPAASTVDSLFDYHQKKSVVKIEKSFFGNHKISRHGDNLDRLFALLNSDSEEDL